MDDKPAPTSKHEHFITRAEATGRWWEEPWWEDPACEIHFTVTKEALRQGAAVLQQHFDAVWYRRLALAPRPNLVFPKLCLERSTFALEFIATFGARLGRLEDAQNLQRPLRALRESYDDSAFLEIETAEAFAQCGFQVSFPIEGGTKSPDIHAIHGAELIAIECKKLGDEQWEDWESSLMRELSRALPHEHNGQEIVVQVALNPRLSEVRFGAQEHDAINAAIVQAIKQTIVGAVDAALKKSSLRCEFVIPDIARLRIAPKQADLYGSVSGMERSVPAIFRRIFQQAIFRAIEQLPKGKPGAIVLYSKHAPPADFFRLLFDAATGADRARFDDLVGVMICTLQTWFVGPKPWFFKNAFTAHEHAAVLVRDTLTKTFPARLA